MVRKSRLLSGLKMTTDNSSSENQAEQSSHTRVQSRKAVQSHNRTVTTSSLSQIPLDQGARSSQPQRNQDPPPIIEHEFTEIIDNVGRRYRKRGRTTMASVWNLSSDEKIFVEVNKFGVPCTREAAVLGSFLGTIATNGTLAPVNFSRWDDKYLKPFYRKMLAVVEEKFEFPPETRKWVLQSINKKWRDHKSDLKSKYFVQNKTMEQIESYIPEGIVPSQWPTLVQSWFTETHQRVSAKNSVNALQNRHSHTSGRMSYARRRKEMEKEGKSPDRLTFYEVTHRRKDGTYVDDNIKKLMDKASALQVERSQNSNNSITDVNEQIFQEVMGKEHNGRVRGLGLGPTPRSYFGATSYNVAEKWKSSTSSSQSNEVAVLKETLQEMTSKYEEVSKKYEVLSTNHEGVSQTLFALANFVSEKFPGQHWMPSQVNKNQFSDHGSGGNVQHDVSSRSSQGFGSNEA